MLLHINFPTFSGDGFVGEGRTLVTIGQSQCLVQSVNHSTVICITQPGLSSLNNVTVSVLSSQGQTLEASCTGDCQYLYSEDYTPLTFTASPSQVRAGLYQTA